jgi:hypothetical protein
MLAKLAFKFNANCALDTGISITYYQLAKLISTLSNTTTPTLPLTLPTTSCTSTSCLGFTKILKLLKHQHKLFD